MRRQLIALSLLLWAMLGSLTAVGATEKRESLYRVSKTPEWVVPVTLSETLSESRALNQPNQYLLTDKQVRAVQGTQTVYSRSVTRPLTPDGVREAARVTVLFDPIYEKLNFHSIAITRGEDTKELIGEIEPSMIRHEPELQNEVRSGKMLAVFDLPGVRVNDVIEVSYTREGSNPVFSGRYFGAFNFGWVSAVDRATFRLISDRQEIKFRSHHRVMTPKKGVEKNGLSEWTLELKSIAGTANESNYLPGKEPYAWLEYSEFRDWSEVQDWANALFDLERWSGQLSRDMVNQLKGDADSTEAAIGRMINYVQNDIRYLSLSIGENSHRPKGPKQTLSDLTGDCKDKALLLVLLLRSIGVESNLLLVSANRQYALPDRLPSPAAFDHVITTFEYKDKTYYIDPTIQYQASHLHGISQPDYGKGLILGSSRNELSAITPEKISKYKVKVQEIATITGFDEPVLLTIIIDNYGWSADQGRRYFSNSDQKTINERYLDIVRRYYKSVELAKDVIHLDEYRDNRFRTIENYLIDDYFKYEEASITVTSSLTQVNSFYFVPDKATRSEPFYYFAPYEVDIEYQVQFPDMVWLGLKPESLHTKIEDAEFRVSERFTGEKYVQTSTFSMSDNVIDSDAYSEFRQTVDQYRRRHFFALNAVDPNRSPGLKDIIVLRQRLKELADIKE